MAQQRSDYPLNYDTGSGRDKDASGMADKVADQFKTAADDAQQRLSQAADQARQYAEQAQEAAKQFKPYIEASLKERPMATLAGFALVGFVLGALWKK
jgi:ElaB/YqjD/DUF883 family membrane-anchored ribosome-binding protein